MHVYVRAHRCIRMYACIHTHHTTPKYRVKSISAHQPWWEGMSENNKPQHHPWSSCQLLVPGSLLNSTLFHSQIRTSILKISQAQKLRTQRWRCIYSYCSSHLIPIPTVLCRMLSMSREDAVNISQCQQWRAFDLPWPSNNQGQAHCFLKMSCDCWHCYSVSVISSHQNFQRSQSGERGKKGDRTSLNLAVFSDSWHDYSYPLPKWVK